MSVVLTDTGDGGTTVLSSLAGWYPEHVRVELLAIDGDGDHSRSALREQLAGAGRPWRRVARPLGGQAAVLAAAAGAAENEFVLVGVRGCPAFGLVEPALSWMWAEGADVALISDGTIDPVNGERVQAIRQGRWLVGWGCRAPLPMVRRC